MTRGVSDAVSDLCTSHVPYCVSGERQIPIRDGVCKSPPEGFDCKQSPRSSISSYAEMDEHNSSVKSNGSTYETANNNHVQMAQVPEESHYLKLQSHQMASDVYTNLNQQRPTGDLCTADPPTIYYRNHLEIWYHMNVAWNTQWVISFYCVTTAVTVFFWRGYSWDRLQVISLQNLPPVYIRTNAVRARNLMSYVIRGSLFTRWKKSSTYVHGIDDKDWHVSNQILFNPTNDH